MKVQLTHILQNMFQASSLNEVPVQKLEQIVQAHPYFAPAHFLLAKKLQHDGNGEYGQRVEKAALYFHDPLWLHWQLSHDKAEDETIELPATVEAIKVEEIKAPESYAEPEVISTVETIPNIEPVQPVEEVPEIEVVQHVETSEVEDAPESVESFHEAEEVQQAPEPVTPVETPVAEPVKAIEEKPNGKDDLPFDPYYTIDYFASQGIKAPQEVKPGDKLGMQLKSFTEWLRTMKRTPQPVVEEQSDEAEQQNIQRFAAGSLEGKEVVTETMAEVLVKQDRKEEAIAMYEKLSLLDPSKKAFFAAKIENLKVN